MSYQKVILLITVLGLCISDVKLQDHDPIEMSGTWYVGSASISVPEYRDVQSWKMVFSKTSSDLYTGISDKVIRSTCEKKTEPFNIRVLRQNGHHVGWHISSGTPPDNFEYNVASEIIPNALQIRPTENGAPFRYLALGKDVKSAQRIPDLFKSDPDSFLIDHTECTLDVQKGNTSSFPCRINPVSIFISILFLFLNVYLRQH